MSRWQIHKQAARLALHQEQEKLHIRQTMYLKAAGRPTPQLHADSGPRTYRTENAGRRPV